MINIFKLLGKYKKYAILTPILIIFEVFVDISIPFLMSKIVNKISTNEITIKYILHVGFFMICLTVFGCSMGVLAAKCSAIASVGFAKNIRQEIFNKIQDFSFSNINKFSTSSLITRLTTDVNNIQNAFMITIRGAIRAPFMLVGAAIMAILTEDAKEYLTHAIGDFDAFVNAKIEANVKAGKTSNG